MAPKANDLQSIKDRNVIQRYLRYAVELREIASCFVDPGSRRSEAEIRSTDPRTLTLELYFPGEPPQAKQMRISFAVQGILYFAHGQVQNRKGQSLFLSLDVPIFKLQRRDALRMKILNEHGARITVGGKSYIPHDLSATGASFVIMPDEEEFYSLGRMFEGCGLTLLGSTYPVNVEVVTMNRLRKDNSRLIKIGLRFSGFDTAFEQRIAREVYLHSHKIWSRWI